MLLRGLKNLLIGEMNRTQKAAALWRQTRFRFTEQCRSRIFSALYAVLHNRFHGERTGHFAMSFTAHSVREHKKVQRRSNPEAVFVVGAHHAYVRGATARDLQVHSPGRRTKKLPQRT